MQTPYMPGMGGTGEADHLVDEDASLRTEFEDRLRHLGTEPPEIAQRGDSSKRSLQRTITGSFRSVTHPGTGD